MEDMPTQSKRPRILIVDDEENILNSLRRVLRQEPYELVFAQSGSDALALFKGQDIDMVVSDARMPGMDGATLLAEIHRLKPQCMNVLLTGYADIATIAKAINEGQIYRYISKPWNDHELLTTLRQAWAVRTAEREKQSLVELTHKQNEALEALTHSLEQRVAARTSELEQTADMLDLAYSELRRSYVTTTEVFSQLVNQRIPKEKQTNSQVIAVVRAYGEHTGLDEVSRNDLSMAAALYNVGKLAWRDSLITAPADLMHRNERDIYRSYPAQSESLLMALEPLQDAARLIRHHQEHWNGGGFPDRLKGAAIPFGARLLKLAVDFVELQCAMVLETRQNREGAVQYLRNYLGRLYDPELGDSFIDFCINHLPDLSVIDSTVKVLETRQLEPGMELASNLAAQNGMLLLNAGKVLSRLLIEKLIAFEANEKAKYKVSVKKV